MSHRQLNAPLLRAPSALDGPLASRGGTSSIPTTLAIIMSLLTVCPPHDLLWADDLIVVISGSVQMMHTRTHVLDSRCPNSIQLYVAHSSTSHQWLGLQDLQFPSANHHVALNSPKIFGSQSCHPRFELQEIHYFVPLAFDRASAHSVSGLPTSLISFTPTPTPTMPTKVGSKRAPRKSPPEQVAQLAPYPPSGHHPSDTTILAYPRDPSTSVTTATRTSNIRTKSLVARSSPTHPRQQRGRSADPVPLKSYAIFTHPHSIASTSSLTTSSAFDPSPVGAHQHDTHSRSSSIRSLLGRQAPSPSFDDDDFPPLTANQSAPATHYARADDTPYVSASDMRKSIRAQQESALAKAKTQADLAEARRHREYYADQEARLAVLASGSFDEVMGDHEEEVATRCALKKASLDDGQQSTNSTAGNHYSSPARRSHTSNKRNQVSSPSAHYVSKPTGDELATYLEPGGTAEREVRSSIRHARNVVRSTGRTRVAQGASRLQDLQARGTATDRDDYILSRVGPHLAKTTPPRGDGDSFDDNSSQGYEMDDDEDSYGQNAVGTSPLLAGPSPNGVGSTGGVSADVTLGSAALSHQVQFQGGFPESADGRAVPPPTTGRSSLRASSFVPVIVPSPILANAVDVDPDFFEGALLPGSGPGPHFITVSFIKNGKDKIKDQLLSTLATTLTLLSQNVPGVLLHCITKGLKIAPLDSTSASHFPNTGMGACNYMYVQNKWSLQPGTRNKLKLPAAKVGKDGRPLFDENRGYDGPDRITAVLWITCDGNAKDAIEGLQMELEGEHLQIRWKQAQKKNTKNQIVIYGIPPVFDAEGIMGELLHGLTRRVRRSCVPLGQPFPSRSAITVVTWRSLSLTDSSSRQSPPRLFCSLKAGRPL